jgi:hypothetical protein
MAYYYSEMNEPLGSALPERQGSCRKGGEAQGDRDLTLEEASDDRSDCEGCSSHSCPGDVQSSHRDYSFGATSASLESSTSGETCNQPGTLYERSVCSLREDVDRLS